MEDRRTESHMAVMWVFRVVIVYSVLASILGASQDSPNTDYFIMSGNSQISPVSTPLHGPDGIRSVGSASTTPKTFDTLSIVISILLLGGL